MAGGPGTAAGTPGRFRPHRFRANNVWGVGRPRVPTRGLPPPHVPILLPGDAGNGWASSRRPDRTSGPTESATQPRAPPGHREPRASCSRSPQLPTPHGRREVPSAPLPAPRTS